MQGWLYPRQAEGKNLYNNETLYLFKDEEQFDGGPAHLAKGEPKFTPWMFFETEDMTNNQGWFTLPQLPRGDIYRCASEIQIRGLVDESDIGTAVGVQDWQIIYDNEEHCASFTVEDGTALGKSFSDGIIPTVKTEISARSDVCQQGRQRLGNF